MGNVTDSVIRKQHVQSRSHALKLKRCEANVVKSHFDENELKAFLKTFSYILSTLKIWGPKLIPFMRY